MSLGDNMYYVTFCTGAILGAIVMGLIILAIISKPKDPEFIKNCLWATLPSDKAVTFEWLYLHLELSPKDTPVLRAVLIQYEEKDELTTIESANGPVYMARTNVLT